MHRKPFQRQLGENLVESYDVVRGYFMNKQNVAYDRLS